METAAQHTATPEREDHSCSLPKLCDGRLTVRDLRRWSGEYDAIGQGERYPARAFVEWIADNLVRPHGRRA